MNIVEIFRNHFGSGNSSNHDFTLVEYEANILIGVDSSERVCVVVKSSNPRRFPIKHKTQKMSIECNMKVRYGLNGELCDETVHIIRCLSEIQREKYLFLELATVLIQESDGSEEAIMETFNTLRTFFNDKKELLICATRCMILENILSQRIQFQKTTCCIYNCIISNNVKYLGKNITK